MKYNFLNLNSLNYSRQEANEKGKAVSEEDNVSVTSFANTITGLGIVQSNNNR